MDEAFLLGLGKYREKNGIINRTDIMLKHLNRVVSIANKYSYQCLMWSDMFYRLAFNRYYTEDCKQFDENIIKEIPANIQLIYWDYYNKSEEHFSKIINQHKQFNKEIWFAGGAWTYIGFLSDNAFTKDEIIPSVAACKKNQVKNYLLTLWGDDGMECSIKSTMPSLLILAETAYGNADINNINDKFKLLTKIDINAFYISEQLDKINNLTDEPFTDPSKYLLYNDCFNGQLDSTVTSIDEKEYLKIAEKIKPFCKSKEYGYFFMYSYYLAKALAIKASLGIKSRSYYQNNDKKALWHLATHDYRILIKNLKKFYKEFINAWEKEKKQNGLELHIYRLGGIINRVTYCQKQIKNYCQGRIATIDELSQKMLDYFGDKEVFTKKLCYINRFDQIYSVNYQ